MLPEQLLQSVAMFFSLSSLLRWKRRRQTPRDRMSRGLRLFVLSYPENS